MKTSIASALLLFSTAATWAQHLESFGLNGLNVTSLAITPIERGIPVGNYLHAGTDGKGVFRRNLSSPDSDWVHIGLDDKKITAVYVYHWGVGPIDFNTLYAGVAPNMASGDSTVLYRLADNGAWVPSDSGIDHRVVPSINALGGFFFSGHEPPRPLFSGGGGWEAFIYRAGGRWEQVFTIVGSLDVIQTHQSRGQVWAGGGWAGFTGAAWIAKSTDAGNSWTPMQLNVYSNAVLSIAIHPANVDTVCAGIVGAVLKTTNGGVTWDSTALNNVHVWFHGLAIDSRNPEHIYAGGEWLIGGLGPLWALWESFDGGNKWKEICPSYRQHRGISNMVADPHSPNLIYIATTGYGVWRYQSRSFPAKVIRVPEDFSKIQTAIDSAVAGDTVLVGPGIYVDNISFGGKNVVLKSAEGSEKTIIDGNQRGSVVTFASGEDSATRLEGFTLRNGSGTVGTDGKLYGGAIYCSSSSPSIIRNVIRDNLVMAPCSALGGGIAIIGDSKPLIERNAIYANTATSLCDALVNFGGGVFVGGTSSPRIRENIITRNNADFGGVAVMDSAKPVIQRNIIAGNERGEVLVSEDAVPLIGGAPGLGNDFVFNDFRSFGPQLERRGEGETINAQYNYFGVCPPTENEVTPLEEFDTSNCQRFAVRTYFPLERGNNWTFGEVGAMTETVIDTFTLGGRFLFYRFDQFRHVERMALRLTEENKLTYRLDPMSIIEHTWVDFGAEIGDQWVLSLGEGSWTVELQSKTDTVTVPAGTFTECYRFFFDWGCCDNSWAEWYAPGIGPVKRELFGFAVIEYPLVSAVIHGVPLSVEENPSGDRPARFSLHQNYPNPFNAGTVIGYEVPQPSLVSLEIYNVLGQKVRTLFSGMKQAGAYRVRWDGTDDSGKTLTGGIYFCRLRAGDWVIGRKLVLLP